MLCFLKLLKKQQQQQQKNKRAFVFSIYDANRKETILILLAVIFKKIR